MTTSSVASNSSTNLVGYMANTLVNPRVANQSELIPVLQNTTAPFLQSSGQLQSTAGATITSQMPQIQTTTLAPSVASTTAPLSQLNASTGTYNAVTSNAVTGTAEQMQVNELSTVQGQLKKLYDDMASGQIPQWAQASVVTANEVLAQRGLKPNSSIGYAAIQGAVQAQALNIAAADAATYFKADLSNFDAKQQTNLLNIQNRQQSMLTNQAAENASLQFNASNQQQVQTFMANLVAQVNDSNANRIQAADVYTSDKKFASEQFYQQAEYQRLQFNATQQAAIDQSNVAWRRQLNTANTAAVNAANQFNVQNAFNLSATAMNNLWQQFRDEAAWAFEASENQKNRNYNTALVANNQSFVRDITEPEWYEQLGGFASALLFGK